ncbi:MAG TPA: hypothetical protein VFP50_19300 [Anaeromyxobacteraceae bacterium]|nr:hypothetical protein [Anaeromyxobacteraceae bacterium]
MNQRALLFAAFLACAASLGPGPAAAADPAPARAWPLVIDFGGTKLIHRWSGDGLHEFTPPDQPNVEHWSRMVSVLLTDRVTDARGLSGLAQAVESGFRRRGTTADDEELGDLAPDGERLVVALLGGDGRWEWTFARLLLHEGHGVTVLSAFAFEGPSAKDEARRWGRDHLVEEARLLLAWQGLPARATLRALVTPTSIEAVTPAPPKDLAAAGRLLYCAAYGDRARSQEITDEARAEAKKAGSPGVQVMPTIYTRAFLGALWLSSEAYVREQRSAAATRFADDATAAGGDATAISASTRKACEAALERVERVAPPGAPAPPASPGKPPETADAVTILAREGLPFRETLFPDGRFVYVFAKGSDRLEVYRFEAAGRYVDRTLFTRQE